MVTDRSRASPARCGARSAGQLGPALFHARGGCVRDLGDGRAASGEERQPRAALARVRAALDVARALTSFFVLVYRAPEVDDARLLYDLAHQRHPATLFMWIAG
jgi:hypothetical protein